MDRFPSQSEFFSNEQEFEGPARWFRCRYPDRVTLTQKESVIEVRPRQGLPADWSMALYAAWVDADDMPESASTFSASSLFPDVVRHGAGRLLNTDVRHRAWQGRSRRRGSGRWWQRPWKRSYEWFLWVLEHRRLLLVASLQSVPGQTLPDDAVDVCSAILESVRFADTPAMPPEPFRREVMKLARRHYPLLTVRAKGRFSIDLQGSEINLSNFYRSYLRQPESLSGIILPALTSVVRLQEWGPDQIQPDLSDVESRIMPMLYSEENARDSLDGFVQLPWIGGLIQVFVIDEDDTYRFVPRRLLERWGLSVEQLRDLAMKNLAAYASEHPMQVNLVGDEEDPRMLVPVHPDPYNSARLLDADLHRRLRQIFGPEVAVGVPNRDFFVAVSLNHPGLMSHVQERVIQDYHSMHHPLTQRLLVISADGVSEYCAADS